MPKNTPEQNFVRLYRFAKDPGKTEGERKIAEREYERWLKRHGKTERDYPEIFAKAAADDAAANPPPPPPDPRVDESVRFDPERHSPANLVEGILKIYVTISEHVRVIFTLMIVFTHVYTRFLIAPRVMLTSKKWECGKSTALEVGRSLAFNPNEEGGGTAAGLEEHFSRGPGSLWLDEATHGDAGFNNRIRWIWNSGFMAGPGSKKSKMVAGRKQTISYYGPVFLAGVTKGVGRLLAGQQQSRAFRLEMQKYTEETRPPRDWTIMEERDFEALRSVYSLLCGWAEKVKLNPRPEMPPGVIARDADNIRGLLAIAEDCGGEWPRRLREALMVLLEQQKAADLGIVLLRHGLAIFEALELERVKTTVFDKELHRLDLPGADWRRYRGLGGDEVEHVITPHERAELLRGFGIETRVMKPAGGGGGKAFRGLECGWFEAALRKHDSPTPDDTGAGRGRLRLITPALGFGLTASPILVTAFSQVPGPVVGAGLPGLVVVCSTLLALARRRRRQCISPAADHLRPMRRN